ncbi:MAG: hypothetical protein U0R19_05590 [Bryobacteraceae bacterium]
MQSRFALFWFGAALALGQEPQLIPGVPAMNAASYLPTGVPGGGVAQGARFVVLGRDFAEPVTAKLEISGPAIDAEVKSVSSKQIEIMAPRFTSTGTGWVVLNVAGKELRAPIIMLESAPGILTRSRTGTGAAVAIDAGLEPFTPNNPAVTGDLVRVRTTGIGALPNLSKIEVIIGTQTVPVAGVTTYPDGYDDIEFELPEVTAGCAVPLAIKTGSFVSNYTTLPVGSRGTLCPDSSRPANYEQLVKDGARLGSITLGRTEIGMKQFKMRADAGGASFLRYNAQNVSEGFALPSSTTAGVCTLIRAYEQDQPEVSYTSLDAGPKLTVTGTGGAKDMSRESKGSYAGRFGEKMMIDLPNVPAIPGGLFFEPGTYTVTGNGGEDVGSFSAHVKVAALLSWTNADRIGVDCGDFRCVQRAEDLKIDWEAGDPNRLVSVMAMSATEGRPAGAAIIVCNERADKGTLTIPSLLLSKLPASPSREPQSLINFSVTNGEPNQQFTASGIDLGLIGYSDSVMRTVAFR